MEPSKIAPPNLNLVWDMETGDPDDFFTLLLLCGHPKINLKAVTVTIGTPDQIGLVRKALDWFGLDIPVGAYNLASEKKAVSPWYYEVYGDIPPSWKARPAAEILLEYCDAETTLLTGAPLKNLGVAIRQSGEKSLTLGRWVAQGGFAGEGVVSPEKQLPQFRGLRTCPTFNLNGDPKSALAALAYGGIQERYFVSKNVCHGVYYDQTVHQLFAELKNTSLAHRLIWQGMEVYLKEHPNGKKFHDPLAMCCALDLSVGTWAEVELYREKGEWGSQLAPNSHTWIITDYDHDKFLAHLSFKPTH